jgi:hypothetical protein
VLVAFTIECDNEFERQMPHRTSNYGSTAGQGAGPWLVSMAMWWTCMRFVAEDGVRVRDQPGRSGVSKEAISVAMGILGKRGLAVTGPAPDGSRWRDASQGGRGVHSGAMGDDDNAARRPSGGRAAGWMICKAHPG